MLVFEITSSNILFCSALDEQTKTCQHIHFRLRFCPFPFYGIYIISSSFALISSCSMCPSNKLWKYKLIASTWQEIISDIYFPKTRWVFLSYCMILHVHHCYPWVWHMSITVIIISLYHGFLPILFWDIANKQLNQSWVIVKPSAKITTNCLIIFYDIVLEIIACCSTPSCPKEMSYVTFCW